MNAYNSYMSDLTDLLWDGDGEFDPVAEQALLDMIDLGLLEMESDDEMGSC